MVKIGMTGPTGSGKGYIGLLFEERGIPCFDTDKAVHRIYDKKRNAGALCRLFSCDLLNEKGTVDRKKLGNLVFSDEEKMNKLLAFVYPLIRKECEKFLLKAEKEGKKAAVVDAPQLFEAGFEKDYDLILCVSAPLETRLARVIARDGITREEALVRVGHQMSEEEYETRCGAVIRNGENDRPAQALDRLLEDRGISVCQKKKAEEGR